MCKSSFKPKNIKEAKELVKRYEIITLKEIKDVWEDDDPVNVLTGFGNNDTCTLCIAINVPDESCAYCIYGKRYECIYNENRKTYGDIESAKTPKELLSALRARAKRIKSILKNIKTK